MRRLGALVLSVAALGFLTTATPAAAFNPIGPICSATGFFSGLAGKACNALQHAHRFIGAGKKLLTGHLGGAAKALLGNAASSSGSAASTAIGLAAIGAWVVGGARFALHETAKVLGQTTSPQLRTTWFSGVYWRMAGLAAVLTLPFLFAAAIQALARSDLALLGRAAFGYLPLAFLAVGIAAPLTMLLLAVSDQLSAVVASAAGNASTHFLDRASLYLGALTVLSGSPFLAFLVGLFTAAAALALWLELLMREAAVYVIVLMLPLLFAAMVWPARRVWAIRAIELLIALIMSKFAIVAVLALGGGALSHGLGGGSVTSALAGFVLVLMAAFAPWALLRLIPLAELASGAAGSLRAEARAARSAATNAEDYASWGHDLARGGGARGGDPGEDLEHVQAGGNGAAAEVERLAALAAVGNGATTRSAGDEGADSAGPGSGSVDEEDTGGPPEERIPGLGAIWQQPDMSWRPLTLGLDEGWPPPRVWPPEAQAPEAGPEVPGDGPAGGADGGGGVGGGPDTRRGGPDSESDDHGGEDHDPRPPGQDPDGGRL